MIELTTPIQIYPNTYTHLQIVKCDFDLRSGSGTFLYALVNITGALVYLGVEKRFDGQVISYHHPAIMRSVQLSQNLSVQDPIIQAIYQGFVPALEEVDQHAVASFADQVFDIGVTGWSLAGSFASIGARLFAHELLDYRSAPIVSPVWYTTNIPTVEII